MGSSGPSTDVETAAETRDSRSRASATIELQERERLRVGFDLHDGPAQTMSAALLQVKMLEDLGGEELHSGLAELRATLASALEEVYELIENLGSRDGEDSDLLSRIGSCVDGFKTRCDIETSLVVTGSPPPLSRSLQIAIFRIIQEALSNVSRHSGARRVDVRLEFSPENVVCEIEDDGSGFSMPDVGASPHSREPYGLHSMRERARLLDGECTIVSAPGHGTRVRARIPVWYG